MLINFCQKSLKPTVTCSAISNDGYEVTNLINDSNKGFLAYSCIKPPIHIDFTFICDVRISRVVIWPSVGAQKSCGFELSVKSGEGSTSEYKRISMGFLGSAHPGVLFHRRDIAETSFNANPNFLQCPIRVTDSGVVNNVRNLRISILKTENSVPAIGGVQVWGRVSQSCGKRTIVDIHNLWKSNSEPRLELKVTAAQTNRDNVADTSGSSSVELCAPGKSADEDFNVPESYLDPITWNIMIQPIVLPSGVTIDQSTLEKHAKSEATWGRALSDPFTGMPFNESRKPIVASALKARIDKFLLDNKHAPDVMTMPRLSGHKQVVNSLRNRSVDLSKIGPDVNRINIISNAEIAKCEMKSTNENRSNVTDYRNSHRKIQTETRVHRLPVIAMCAKRNFGKRHSKITKMKPAASLAVKNEINGIITNERIVDDCATDSNLDRSVKNVLSTLQRFDDDERSIRRKCLDDCRCVSNIFYKLPCDHVVCKDVIVVAKNSRCAICGVGYSTRDPLRVHSPSRID